jgi:hypothetical protein
VSRKILKNIFAFGVAVCAKPCTMHTSTTNEETQMTTMQNMRETYSDMYKDVYGVRPFLTEREWNDPSFLLGAINYLEEIIGKMSPEDQAAEGWSIIEGDDVDCDDSDDGYALASAGWGTDEDYGYAEDVL